MRPVPVLMYHHVSPHPGDVVTVSPEIFESQMRHIRESGYRTLTIGELTSYLSGSLTLREKSVVITFDDGWLDNYIYAFPVMKKYHTSATIFIITDRTEKASKIMTETFTRVPTHGESKRLVREGEEHRVVLNWNRIAEMNESGLVEFFSHTKSHRKCDSLSEEELYEELGRSKEIIENKVGRPCPYLCWPYGKFNDRAIEIAKEVGYSALFTIEHGVATAGSDPFAIKRIVIKDKDSWFRRRMSIYTNPILSELYLAIKKK